MLLIYDDLIVGVITCEIFVLRNVYLPRVGEHATDQVCPLSLFPFHAGSVVQVSTRHLDTVCNKPLERWLAAKFDGGIDRGL
jgi:hypothetical protein